MRLVDRGFNTTEMRRVGVSILLRCGGFNTTVRLVGMGFNTTVRLVDSGFNTTQRLVDRDFNTFEMWGVGVSTLMRQ